MATANVVGNEYSDSCTLRFMSEIGKRIRERREELGMSLPQLASLSGLKYQTIQNLENGKSQRSRYMLDIARSLTVRPEWLETGTPPKLDRNTAAPNQAKFQETLTTPDINIHEFSQDVPILGAAACGEDGLFELNGNGDHGFVRRPPKLKGVTGAYALYIDGVSMAPWREHGQLVYVHPTMPIKIGDYVVAELHPEKDSDTRRPAYIKRLLRRTAERLVLEQFNPPEEKTLPTRRVKALHKIVDWSELLGL